MKKFLIPIIALAMSAVAVSCGNRDEAAQPVVRFNPEDTASVDALLSFYIKNNIIFDEMLRCDGTHTDGTPLTYDCLKDGCEIAHDYLQDSLSPYFFMELNCMSGSCGNNIYILKKSDPDFEILFDECGTIDQELGPDTIVNGFKVIYFEKELKTYRIIFDGNGFVSEELPSQEIADNL
ncbi:MAG: hypothetical protein IJT51_01845 [Bacteroidales bacterium]|nr:hypothetical protein [Bacteroidales bacterium]